MSLLAVRCPKDGCRHGGGEGCGVRLWGRSTLLFCCLVSIQPSPHKSFSDSISFSANRWLSIYETNLHAPNMRLFNARPCIEPYCTRLRGTYQKANCAILSKRSCWIELYVVRSVSTTFDDISVTRTQTWMVTPRQQEHDLR